MQPRVLLAITVYNAEAEVMRCLASVGGLDRDGCAIDVVVLDDHSPAPGFSERLHRRCAELRIGCYTTPRNLGIPRNVNLGLLLALEGDYDYVIISNSDVIYPPNAVTSMLAAARDNEAIGSVTAWSNNVSIYSLPVADADPLDAGTVQWLAATLQREFGSEVLDVPAGISFCILIPVAVAREVGLMDPVFGRGYCEELDWNLRAKALGLRSVLGLGTFVFHEGGASSGPAGLLAAGHTTVPANEAIIDLRYPTFRSAVGEFVTRGEMPDACDRAASALVRRAAQEDGYVVDVTLLDRPPADPRLVHCKLEPIGDCLHLAVNARGVTFTTVVPDHDPANELRRLFGCDPALIRSSMSSPVVDRLAAAVGPTTILEVSVLYPERI